MLAATPNPGTPLGEFLRLPGLFRRWEFDQVIDLGADFHVEDSGTTSDGTALFTVYRRVRPTGWRSEE